MGTQWTILCTVRQEGRPVFIERLSQALIVSGGADLNWCWEKVTVAACLLGGAGKREVLLRVSRPVES